MSIAAGTRARPSGRTHAGRRALRLVHGEPPEPRLGEERESPRVLIAAAGAQKRAAVRRELTSALAPGTPFDEAGSVWEVLQQAPTSGVVMLAGDLEDVPAPRLVQVLGQRYPWLPIIVLEAPAAGGA